MSYYNASNIRYNSTIYTGVYMQPHLHSSYELIYALEGKTEVTLNGASKMLFEGELMLISPYSVHGVLVDSRSRAWIGSGFDDMILPFSEKNENLHFSSFTCDGQIEKMLQKYLFIESEPEHFMLMSCLYMVCNECEKNAKSAVRRGEGAFMRSVTEYVTENLSSDVSLREMAELLGYEYHYASMLFNDCFGINFKSFLNMLRYDTACRQLSDKSKDISEISQACGFGSVRNFNRVFKSMSGMTPREYRSVK